ncbi:META domain-containing protein [Carboxylicivirga sp. M1479]|uniref:META domain-containing protein n=1 Tax=Carboxylicivirga sp. M1479 TaxID=2594476 RepID=UPI001177F54C|nr:META domain-containing protein [Carboxylicivirga sp. M1479]TRX70512.1 META domain-containing protein [Carboxylicivirga sp. M1479]
MKNIFLVIMVAGVLFSCKTAKSSSRMVEKETVVAQELFKEGNTWELISYNGQAPGDVGFIERLPTLIINKAEGRVGGYSGCNSFGGAITFDDNKLHIDKVMSTKRYCDGVPEHEFFMMLQQPLMYKIEDSVLKLFKEDALVLSFQLKQ